MHDEMSGITKTIPVTRTEMVESQVEETEYRAIDDILKIEDALTRVQAQKLKAVKLMNFLIDDEKQIRTALL